MSHLTTELCKKYAGERIPQWEYDLEAREWAAAGFSPTALAEGARYRLPKGCFFSQTGTKEDVLRTWTRIVALLGRRVRLECTIGLSFGKDLQPLEAPTALSPGMQAQQAPQPVPSHDPLSNAFKKLFGPTAS